jgi:hypothetical protein
VRVFARGVGPGPKNVGIELDDGTRIVVTYRTYKYKYQPQIGEQLPDKVYTTVSGQVQFEPKHREANGKKVIDIAVRARGTGGEEKLVNITIWPEYLLAAEVKRGDFISADGSIEARTYQDASGATKEGLNLSPTSLVHVPQVAKAEREVVQSSGGSSSAPF